MKLRLSTLTVAVASIMTLATMPVAASETETSIVALVNDEPISNHDIEMRTRLFLANSPDVKKRLEKAVKQDKTQQRWREMVMKYRPGSQAEAQKLQQKLLMQIRDEIRASMKKGLRGKILKELVDERLQLQQANKLGVAVTDEELDSQLEAIAQRNKSPKTGKPMNRGEFGKLLTKMGIPLTEFRNRMRAKSSWIRVIRQKFRFQVNIADQDVDRMIDSGDEANTKTQTVYSLERVRFDVPVSASEKAKVDGLMKAETLRQAVHSCKQLKSVAARYGASVRKIGSKAPDTLPQTLQIYLSNTQDGQMTPPALTSAGIELYAVCDRKQRRITDPGKRQAVKEKLRQQEFEVLARRYLQDLRQEASIEYR